MKKVISWVEIPAQKMDRAVSFSTTVIPAPTTSAEDQYPHNEAM